MCSLSVQSPFVPDTCDNAHIEVERVFVSARVRAALARGRDLRQRRWNAAIVNVVRALWRSPNAEVSGGFSPDGMCT